MQRSGYRAMGAAMSNGNGSRASLLDRLRQMLGRQPEHSLRESIAELVLEAAEE